ncbi:hypothetical protein E8E14_013303 [Neopestalotiopsis sp. 37M]|nr:hypothetical protein E8E14_013303 [Neopestalotiopsis sp. 37M]
MAYCSRTRPWRPYLEGYHGFGFVDGQRPAAALRELTLVNYRFGKREIPNDETSEPSSTIKKYPLPGLEEDYWADTFDWSQLEHLDIDNLKLAERIAPQLTSLRELVAVNLSHAMSYDENSIADLHTRVPARLESITVVSMKSVGLDGLQRHGSSLRKLQVHHEHSRDWHNSAIDQCTMQNIHDFCPNLEDLSIDVRRDGEWPYSTLDVIASFPRLRHLTIWFELGYNREVPIKPYVTASAAQHLFRYVWGKSPTQRSPLRTMTINSGSVPSGRRASDLETSQASHKSTTFVFTVSERDDGMPEGRYHLQVGGLPAADSAFLQEGSTVKEPRLDTKDWREYRLSLVKYGPKLAEDQENN